MTGLSNLLRPNGSAVLKEALRTLSQTRPMTEAQQVAREMSLAEFFRQAWHVLEPSTPLVWNWHLEVMAEHLQALYEGRLRTHNLAISVPPGSAKSRVVSVIFPAWVWIRQPSWRGIFASGNPRVSTRDSLLTRALIGSAWYQTTFGIQWAMSDSQDQKTLFTNSMTGSRMATTSGSKITGDRGDFLGVDDALDSADAYSKASRDAVNIWFSQAFANRLNDLRTGKRCIIAQRLHSEDPIGFVMTNEPSQWEHIVIPMLWEEARRAVTSLGWTDPRTTDGELMFPERFPADIVEAERQRLGSSGFAGQMQQRPASAEGELFKRGCMQFLPADAAPVFTQVILSLDTAFSVKTTADYSVCIVLGQFDKGILILDVVKGRYAYPQLKALCEELAARWHPSAVVVEHKASGQSLVQSLQQETVLPVVAVVPDTDKIARAHAITPTWEAHRVFALMNAPWLSDFEEEIYAFPKAPHDDQTDAFTQGIKYLTLNQLGQGLVDFYSGEVKRQEAAKADEQLAFAKRPGVVVTELQSPWHTP
jgi:predicted phage terminase large subunit-like protein